MNKKLLQMVIPESTEQEIREACRASDLDFDIEGALFPHNPLLMPEPTISIDEAVELLRAWDSVRSSEWDSEWDLGWDSEWDLVWDLVWGSVGDLVGDLVYEAVKLLRVGTSVGASVGAYTSSLFPNIKKWQGVEHAEGENPFQSGIDLWMNGYVPSFDGKVWRLHAGETATIVWEGEL